MKVTACAIPEEGLLQAYAGVGANYTDCFETALPEKVALAAFLQAFYTTWLFRLERSILMLLLRRRIPDAEVAALAQGSDSFAVWQVEARRDDQILLRERSGHTCSFFAVEALEKGGTRLLFGSAVVAREGRPLGWVITAFMPLHKFYARALLALAARKLRS